MKKISIVLIITSFVLGFSMSSFANEEFNAVTVDGPGIFTGQKGEIPIFKSKKKQNNTAQKVQGEQKVVELSKGAEIDTYTEFELFKELKIAKSENNALYQEFENWVEFKKFKSSNPKK